MSRGDSYYLQGNQGGIVLGSSDLYLGNVRGILAVGGDAEVRCVGNVGDIEVLESEALVNEKILLSNVSGGNPVFVEVLIDSVGDGIGRTGFDVDASGPLLSIQSGDQLVARVSQGGSFQFDLPFGGTVNGRPYWGDLGDITLLQWTGSEWVYFDDGVTIFSSDEDVATPDLVTTWSGGYEVELIPATVQQVKDAIDAEGVSGLTTTILFGANNPIEAQNVTPFDVVDSIVVFEDTLTSGAFLGGSFTSVEVTSGTIIAYYK